MPDDVIQAPGPHRGQILPHLLRQEREVIHQILIPPHEVLPQRRVLRRHAHRASVQIALPHHHAAQHDERRRTEAEFLGAQQGHQHDVAARLDLPVHLQPDLRAQSVADECLLRLAQTNLWRDAREAHTRGRARARTSLGTANHDEVGLCLCHACGNRAHATLGHQLHGDGCLRIDVLQVENQLCQVLDAVDVVMGRRRDEADAWDAVAGLGNHLVHLEARQLSALAGLRALRHLDLYLLGVHQILRRHAEATTGHLFRLARQRDAVLRGVEPLRVLAALARIASCAQFVHRETDCLVRLLAQCTERHGSCHEVLHNLRDRLHLVETLPRPLPVRAGSRYFLKAKEITDKDG